MSSNEKQSRHLSEGLQVPGLVQTQEQVEQLSFTTNPQTPAPSSVSLSQSSRLFLADEDTAPRPISQAGVAESWQPVPSSPGYFSGPSSLAGLADMYTQPQLAAQTLSEEAQQPAWNSAEYASGPGSLAGLENLGSIDQFSSEERAKSALVTRDLALSVPTRVLLDPQTEALQSSKDARPTPYTTASRPPMVIRGGEHSRVRTIRPPQGRRHVIGISALVLLLVFTGGMLFAVSPLGHDVRATLTGQLQGVKIIPNAAPGSMSLIAQATATAVIHQKNDGVDPTSNSGGPVLSTSGGSLNWPFGYCTYWANLRYHARSGHWVSWHGNANQWVAGAYLAGWHVSTSPHVPSILVLMSGVQGASYVGHVAVVESASGNVAHTSNMNWYAGGGFGIVSNYNFTTGPGVYFIWA
ncbi:MAG TPA: CHAP domain-containing protein [Ktedonobacteraceae bacterium]